MINSRYIRNFAIKTSEISVIDKQFYNASKCFIPFRDMSQKMEEEAKKKKKKR